MPVESIAIPPDSKAPDFVLQAAGGNAVSLRDYHGIKNVVLVFLRGFA